MKKLLLFVVPLFFAAGVFGQNVPNGNLETWTTIANDWHLANFRNMSKPHDNVVKYQPAQHGNYALKFETVLIDGELEPGVALGTWANNPGKGIGGFPYKQKPSKLYVYAKYDMKEGDSASIWIYFKKNGARITGLDQNVFKIGGSYTSGYKMLEFDIKGLTETPDTLIINLLGCNYNDMLTGGANTYKLGSYIIFDNFSFDTSDPIPFCDFEEWGRPVEIPQNLRIMGAYEVVVDCNVKNPTEKTTDSHSGNYALVTSTYFNPYANGDGVVMGVASGNTEGDDGMKFPCNIKKGTLTAWYKYLPKTQDTAAIGITFFKNGNMVNYTWAKELYAQAQYTKIDVPFELNETPDSAYIEFSSSIRPLTKNIGSKLYIDDITMVDNATAIASKTCTSIEIYPNPVINQFRVSGLENDAIIAVFDLNGKMCLSQPVKGPENIELSGLPKGMYIVKINTGGETVERKLIKK